MTATVLTLMLTGVGCLLDHTNIVSL